MKDEKELVVFPDDKIAAKKMTVTGWATNSSLKC